MSRSPQLVLRQTKLLLLVRVAALKLITFKAISLLPRPLPVVRQLQILATDVLELHLPVEKFDIEFDEFQC